MRRKTQQWPIQNFMVNEKSFWLSFHLLFNPSTPFECTKVNFHQPHIGSLQLLTLNLRKLKTACKVFVNNPSLFGFNFHYADERNKRTHRPDRMLNTLHSMLSDSVRFQMANSSIINLMFFFLAWLAPKISRDALSSSSGVASSLSFTTLTMVQFK